MTASKTASKGSHEPRRAIARIKQGARCAFSRAISICSRVAPGSLSINASAKASPNLALAAVGTMTKRHGVIRPWSGAAAAALNA